MYGHNPLQPAQEREENVVTTRSNQHRKEARNDVKSPIAHTSPNTPDSDKTVHYSPTLNETPLFLSAPDTYYESKLAPYMKAFAVKKVKEFLRFPCNGGPSLSVEKRLEQKMRQTQANLPNDLKIICGMLSHRSQNHFIGSYVEIASEVTQECEDNCAHIQVEIDKLKSALPEK
jgi:hypothetical protein